MATGGLRGVPLVRWAPAIDREHHRKASKRPDPILHGGNMKSWQYATMISAASAAFATASAQEPPKQDEAQSLTKIEVTGQVLGKGEARANSIIDKETIQQQPPGLDPLKFL